MWDEVVPVAAPREEPPLPRGREQADVEFRRESRPKSFFILFENVHKTSPAI